MYHLFLLDVNICIYLLTSKNFKYNLFKGAAVTRQDELKKYETWLEARLAEAKEKTGDDQISFIQGILYQAETISENIAKDPPIYPNLDTLSKTPAFSEAENTAKDASIPHELIKILRQFIEITELKPTIAATTSAETATDAPAETNAAATDQATTTEQAVVTPPTNNAATPTAEATTTEAITAGATEAATVENRIIGGSQHSNIDWNTRLKVPQYRTQSDNLSVPEATCSYTSLAMTLERLGNTRADVVAAIDSKLSNNVEDPDLKALWEQKSKQFFEKITSDAEAGHQKLRGHKEGLVGKEDELSKVFKENGQMEDLIYFYKYLLSSSITRSDTLSTYRDKLPEKINDPSYTDTDDGVFSSKKETISAVKLTMEHRNKIRENLDSGGSVIISVNHKGTSGTHILHVQSISSEGIIVDDPYGGHEEKYRYGTAGHLLKDKGGTNYRSTYDYKNVVHTNVNETDYTKRDFTAEAAQNLVSDESRGKSQLIKWEMINDSSAGFIYYVAYYEKS